MGAGVDIIRAPARLAINPTDLRLPFPFGGVSAGKTKLTVIRPLGTAFRVWNEGRGEATDVLEAENQCIVTTFLRGWTDAAVQHLYAGGYREGRTSQQPIWSMPGNTTPGGSALPRAVRVVIVPDDPLRVPSVVVYRGVPNWSEGAEVMMQRTQEFGFPVALDCLRDAADRIIDVGPLVDLTL